MVESAGVPLPGETILIASGILAQQNKLDLGDVILFGALGPVSGDQIGYWVGRKGGRPFVLRWGRYVKITHERLAGAERFFARHGGKAVFFARFFSGLRVFGALVAGMSRMHWGTFVFYNALGGAVWATAAVLVGYLLGGSLGIVERWLGKASLLLGITAVLAVILYVTYRWAANHPERIRGAFERLGGERIQRFLASPAGLWLRRRLSPHGAYGLVLTAGLVLTGLFSWALGAVVQDANNRLKPSWSGIFALCTLAFSTRPSVSTSRWRFRPRTFLCPSYPLCSPPTPVVLMVCESAIPALGSGFLPERVRTTSRRAALSRSKVPFIVHFLNQL
jgi:membrane protein DedA with SNARE-associated domain